MKYNELTNFTHTELSTFTHLELTLKQLNEICDQLSRNELTIPQDIAVELNSIFISLDNFKSTVIKTLPDFIHVAAIFCKTYQNASSGNSVIPRLIIAADTLLQFYQSKKSS